VKQIFILGSSSAYGVGAEDRGWGDQIKKYFHAKMFSSQGIGERYEVYNFAKSGATIDFVIDIFPRRLKEYGRGDKPVVVLDVGGNNSKAEGKPDNFVSTPEEYTQELKKLVTVLKSESNKVIFVCKGFVDETRTNPKHNPLTGHVSYFTNSRRKQFESITKQICEENGLIFVELGVEEGEWVEKYLYTDGLHPNQAGHNLIFDAIKVHLSKVEP